MLCGRAPVRPDDPESTDATPCAGEAEDARPTHAPDGQSSEAEGGSQTALASLGLMLSVSLRRASSRAFEF